MNIVEKNVEIITLAEALKRIHLDELDSGRNDELVAWTGYPVPFACGHYKKRANNDVVRFSQAGKLLFEFRIVSKNRREYNGVVFIAIENEGQELRIVYPHY